MGQRAVIITIDGPAGSGKSTAARKLAARLGIPYLDTGAMYRAVTLAALQSDIDLENESALTNVAEVADMQLDLGPTHIRVTMNGHDVTEELRSMHVNSHTRYAACSPGVRRVLVRKQREIRDRLGALVTEGRDQGSVVFPDADAKFFLDASAEKRAQRRLHELLADGEDVTFDQVLNNIVERDRTDSERDVGPLVRPENAIELDTTELTIGQVLDELIAHLRSTGLLQPDHDRLLGSCQG